MTFLQRIQRSVNGLEMIFPSDVRELLAIIGVLRAAIVQTLDDNSYLADGEDCTLSVLKKALRDVEMPWEVDKEG